MHKNLVYNVLKYRYRYTKRRSENQNKRARQHTEVYARENGHGWTRRPKYSSQSEAGNC